MQLFSFLRVRSAEFVGRRDVGEKSGAHAVRLTGGGARQKERDVPHVHIGLPCVREDHFRALLLEGEQTKEEGRKRKKNMSKQKKTSEAQTKFNEQRTCSSASSTTANPSAARATTRWRRATLTSYSRAPAATRAFAT
jgi:hypothetical protein